LVPLKDAAACVTSFTCAENSPRFARETSGA
jgi:hypothetical protein